MITDKELREALTRVTGLAIFRDPIALSFKELKQLFEVMPSVTGDFPITSVCRDDLKPYGFDIEDISDDEMKELANRMEDDYCEQLFGDSMVIIARDAMGLPMRDKFGQQVNQIEADVS